MDGGRVELEAQHELEREVEAGLGMSRRIAFTIEINLTARKLGVGVPARIELHTRPAEAQGAQGIGGLLESISPAAAGAPASLPGLRRLRKINYVSAGSSRERMWSGWATWNWNMM